MVALEAMERGRPVIAAAIGGLGELVRTARRGARGAGRGRAAARAIVELASDPERAAAWVRPAAAGRSTVPPGPLHRPDRAALPARRSRRPRAYGAPCARPRTRPRAAGPRRAAQPRPGPARARRARSASGSSGGTSSPVSPSTTISGSSLRRAATTGLAAASPRAARARTPPSGPGGRERRPGGESRDVADAAGQEQAANAELARELLQPRALRALAEHDERRVRRRRAREPPTSTPFCGTSRATRAGAASRPASVSSGRPTAGRLVEAVVDDVVPSPRAARPARR